MVKKISIVGGALFALSLVLTLISGDMWNIFVFIAIIYAYVGYSEICKGYESAWIFLLVAISMFPINSMFSFRLFHWSEYFIDGTLKRLLLTGLLFAVIFSVEEIITGTIGRLIWKHQEGDE